MCKIFTQQHLKIQDFRLKIPDCWQKMCTSKLDFMYEQNLMFKNLRKCAFLVENVVFLGNNSRGTWAIPCTSKLDFMYVQNLMFLKKILRKYNFLVENLVFFFHKTSCFEKI